MKFKSLILISGVLLFAANTSTAAVTNSCTDTANSGSGGGNASSSITTAGVTEGASVSASNCGTWSRNDSKVLTAAAGGYGFNLFSTADPDGWVALDKYDVDAGVSGTLITGTGWGGSSGTFSFADAGYDDYLIVLKFDGVYTTFLSNSWADNWEWNTDPDGDNKFDLSNLTVYVKNPSQVPEPAIVGLLAIGLLGMVVARRRMKR